MEAKKNFTFKPRKKGTFGYLGKTGKNTLLLKIHGALAGEKAGTLE